MKTSPRTLAPLPSCSTSRLVRGAFAAATCALTATLAHSLPTAAEEHVGVNAERGDPARWAVPADTPQLKYEAEVKGVRAALAEALKDCRALQGGRTECEAQARAQHARDLADARSHLLRSPGGAQGRMIPGQTR